MSVELKFDHIGIPVDSPQAEEFWVTDSECWVTNPRTHPQRIEYLRFKTIPDLEHGSPEWKLWHMPHIAWRVDDLEAAIAGEEVVLGPFEPSDFGRVVFVHKDGAIIEYLEYTDLAPGIVTDFGCRQNAACNQAIDLPVVVESKFGFDVVGRVSDSRMTIAIASTCGSFMWLPPAKPDARHRSTGRAISSGSNVGAVRPVPPPPPAGCFLSEPLIALASVVFQTVIRSCYDSRSCGSLSLR